MVTETNVRVLNNDQGKTGLNRIGQRIDNYLQRRDTRLAQGLNRLSSQQGDAYLTSKTKRTVDLVLGVPMALAATPIIGAAAVAIKVEDPKGPVFFTQERVVRGGKRFRIRKLRSMRKGSDNGIASIDLGRGKDATENPQNTKVGTELRKYDIDELPQLWQVYLREMSLVGIRPLTPAVFELLKREWSERRYKKWEEAYKTAAHGLMSPDNLLGKRLKDDTKRFPYDMYYRKNASLRLDLFLLWRAIGKITRTLK